jgi:hypothetical protein
LAADIGETTAIVSMVPIPDLYNLEDLTFAAVG